MIGSNRRQLSNEIINKKRRESILNQYNEIMDNIKGKSRIYYKGVIHHEVEKLLRKKRIIIIDTQYSMNSYEYQYDYILINEKE